MASEKLYPNTLTLYYLETLANVFSLIQGVIIINLGWRKRKQKKPWQEQSKSKNYTHMRVRLPFTFLRLEFYKFWIPQRCSQ